MSRDMDRDLDIEGSSSRALMEDGPWSLREASTIALKRYAIRARDERDLLARQLQAVDENLPSWEPEPGSPVGCVGRVQTILNLKADRAAAEALRLRAEAAEKALAEMQAARRTNEDLVATLAYEAGMREAGARSICDRPGGCGPTCRKAIARGDDMAVNWPNGDPEAMYNESLCHPQYDYLDGSVMRCGQDEPAERCREHCGARAKLAAAGEQP